MNILKFIACVAFAVGFFASPSYAASDPDREHAKLTIEKLEKRKKIAREYHQLHKKLTLDGKARVLVKVGPSRVNNKKGAANEKMKELKSLVKNVDAKVKREVARLDYMAIEVDASQLNKLLDSGLLEKVQEDQLLKPTLIESVPWIGGTSLASLGYTGQNVAVAILDTGFDIDHPFLVNRIVEEACFSTNDNQSISTCPNGQEEMFGQGAAAGCLGQFWGDDCSHGSHVAGIAAGDNGTLKGVAPGAKLVAINVFHYNTSLNEVRAWGSDMIAGLEWILNQASTPNIVAANMSIGGGVNTLPCDSDFMSNTIRTLRQANIATVISSGNDFSDTGVSWPSCISDAVTVGSSFKDYDGISGFSNTSPQVDLLAPGSAIYSAVANGSYNYFYGTSMAAPHVTGAFAALRSAFPNSTVDEIEAALKSSGAPVLHYPSGQTYPRVRLMEAYAVLGGNTGTTNVYQAEQQIWSQAAIDTEFSGFSGTGYVNTYDVSGSWVEFKVNVSNAGSYKISVRYANTGPTSRDTDILVNGNRVIAAHPYPATSTWSNWSTTFFTVNLNKGFNNIRLVSTTAYGAPNLDRMELSPVSVANNPPAVTNPINNISMYQTQSATTFSINNVFTDPDGDTLSHSVSIGNSSLARVSISGSTNNPHLTIEPLSTGNSSITLSATDGSARIETQFNLNVATNQHPYVSQSIATYSLTLGAPAFTINLRELFVDPDGDNLIFDYEKSDEENMNVSMPNATSLLVNPQTSGSVTVYVSADDGKHGYASLSFEVNVQSSAGSFTHVVQGENGAWSSGAIETQYGGFNGFGYVNTNNAAGQWVSFSVNVPHSGNYFIDVRYANGVATSRNASVSVDGTNLISSVDFPSTGAWSNWATKGFTLPLSAGYRDIRIHMAGSLGAPNVDQYTVISQ